MPDLMIKANDKKVRTDIIEQKDGFNVSKRYIPIATQDVIKEIRKQAGEVKITGFTNANVRKPGKDGFQKHAVICELPDADMIDGTKMNIIIFNSNDRSTSLKIFMGSLRMACSNQMVWGEQIAEPISIRHTQKDWKESIKDLMDEYEIIKLETEQMIEDMMNKELSLVDTANLCYEVALELIEPDISGQILDPMQFNSLHRVEDRGRDLWHTFNRIQYNMMNGGIKRVIEKEDENEVLLPTISNTHKITDASKQIDFNRRLHKIVMTYLYDQEITTDTTENIIDIEPEDTI